MADMIIYLQVCDLKLRLILRLGWFEIIPPARMVEYRLGDAGPFGRKYTALYTSLTK